MICGTIRALDEQLGSCAPNLVKLPEQVIAFSKRVKEQARRIARRRLAMIRLATKRMRARLAGKRSVRIRHTAKGDPVSEGGYSEEELDSQEAEIARDAAIGLRAEFDGHFGFEDFQKIHKNERLYRRSLAICGELAERSNGESNAPWTLALKLRP